MISLILDLDVWLCQWPWLWTRFRLNLAINLTFKNELMSWILLIDTLCYNYMETIHHYMYVCILSGACWHGNISTLLAFCDPSPVLNLCEGKRSVMAGNPSTHWQALMFTLIYVWTNGWTRMELLVIWNLMTFIWRHYNAYLLQTSKHNFVLQHLSVVCGIQGYVC